MITSKYVVFGTAWKSERPLAENLQKQALFSETLRNHGHQFEMVLVKYAGDIEQSFAIAVYSEDAAKSMARHLWAIHGQSCVGLLELDSMTFSLVFPCGKVCRQGEFASVSESEAHLAIYASFWCGQWWVAK